MSASASRLRLTVTDDGRGWPSQPSSAGLGLAIMRHRARALGGTLSVGHADKRGSRVVCDCPRPG